MKIDYQPDGSFIVDNPSEIRTSSFYIDPENPNRFIPKFEPCKFRRFELVVMNCGRRNGYWHCDLFKRHTCVSDCLPCKSRMT